MSQTLNKNFDHQSLQVSVLKDVQSGQDFEMANGFLIKNITEDDIELTIIPLHQEESIKTVFYSGWNPELVKKIINTPSGIQIGY